MEVILLKDVEKVGSANELVKVKDGFGRNYLIPQGLARHATPGLKKVYREMVRQQKIKEEEQAEELKSISKTLENKVIKIGAKVGKENKIFGAVTTLQVAEAIEEQASIKVDRKKISFLEEIKTTGTYKANIRLLSDLEAEITLEVVSE